MLACPETDGVEPGYLKQSEWLRGPTLGVNCLPKGSQHPTFMSVLELLKLSPSWVLFDVLSPSGLLLELG